METEVRAVTPTERMVASMLVENTGAALLDSGGVYGRAWQRTRAKYGLDVSKNSSFDGFPLGPDPDLAGDEIDRVARMMRDEPTGSIDDFGSVTVNTFHWLVDRLDYDPALDAKWDRFERVHNFGKDRWDKEWGMPLANRFLELLEARGASGGIYPGEGSIDNAWINTYNGEDALDRTLQFALFHVSEDGFLPTGSYVLLQVHGGADVRGGYTDPRLFVCNGEQADLFDNGRIEVWCEGREEDVVPDGQANGQIVWTPEAGWHNGPPAHIGVDGSRLVTKILEPVHQHWNHRWDNAYDSGGTLRLSWRDDPDHPQEDLAWWGPGKVENVLVFARETDEIEELREKGVQIEYGYTNPEGKVIRPDAYATANISTRDEEGNWLCPFDGSKLHADGAIVG